MTELLTSCLILFQSEERHALNFRTSLTVSNSEFVIRFLTACHLVLLI